jgi:hypothetical protein
MPRKTVPRSLEDLRHDGADPIHLNPAKFAPFAREWLAKATEGVDHDGVLRRIAEKAGWSWRYAFLIVISAAISLLD